MAKVISFSSALILMLSLELAMLSSFGEADDAMFRNRILYFIANLKHRF